MRLGWSLAPFALLLFAAGTASADPIPSLDLRNFHPPADPKGSLYLEPTATPAPGDWNAGAWFSYSYRSVTLNDANGNRVAVPLDHQVSLDYFAMLGVIDRLALSLSIPTVLYQNGDDVDPYLHDGKLPKTALGDAAFGIKATLIPTGSLGGFGLGALARVTAPTGDPRGYVSDGAPTGELRLLSELRLIAFAVEGTVGAKVRGSERNYVGEDFGHDLPWGVALAVRPQALGLDSGGHFTWVLESRGQVALTPSFASGPQSPVLLGLSSRYTVGDASAIVGAELPLDDAVGNPKVRAIVGVSWAPRFYDEDGDGVADDVDECPELAEDKDGFEDQDGCPDFDNDDDGVPDEEDRCPTQAEDEDDFQDDDGCPDPDNDGDGIPDTKDACPNEAGPASESPKTNGCPSKDVDNDGVDDSKDKCPTEPEDKDGFQDDDGCPDPDNDHDGVLDEDDACPNVKGPERSDPKLNGCPSPDRDGDTYDDANDKCPDQPEDFDGVDDDDGCPDDDSQKPAAQRAKPLLSIAIKGEDKTLTWRVPPKFSGKADATEMDPSTMPSMRALASELNKNPSWVALVGVRAQKNTAESEQEALNKSFVFANTLRALTHRDECAETIAFSAVKSQPNAYALGFGVLVIGPEKANALAAPPGAAAAKAPTHKLTVPSGPAPTKPPLPPAPKPAPKKP
jgi:OOP family OmpA-OmpF porin